MITKTFTIHNTRELGLRKRGRIIERERGEIVIKRKKDRKRETSVFNFSPLVFNQTLMGRAAGTRRLAVHNRI